MTTGTFLARLSAPPSARERLSVCVLGSGQQAPACAPQEQSLSQDRAQRAAGPGRGPGGGAGSSDPAEGAGRGRETHGWTEGLAGLPGLPAWQSVQARQSHFAMMHGLSASIHLLTAAEKEVQMTKTAENIWRFLHTSQGSCDVQPL